MAAHRRPHALLIGWAAAFVAVTVTAGAQGAGPEASYDRLSAGQQRVVEATWQARAARDRPPLARDLFDSWPLEYRDGFARVTGELAALALFDPENGEVLGSALDLIASVDGPGTGSDTPPAGPLRMAVQLAPAARDMLRRSAEFDLEDTPPGAARLYVHHGTVTTRIAVRDGSRGEILQPR